ncbi:hypothetical protein FACS1894113_5470 [Alphaproteobacteria bacterium]|nr:hypothetical protein FACS1894113_5470 [Alphaproteobacteria bacterium]
MNKKSAIRAIDQNGMLLAFPIDNRPEPKSLWSVFYPRSKMKWEWDEGGDNRVAELWFLREGLSRSRKVVYVKWFRGRATFLSRDLFRALLAVYSRQPRFHALSRDARDLLALLEENSPRSTKQLKRASALVGRALEGTYNRALQELWNRLLIVAFGEVDEGAFPSLAIGATKWIFEDLFREARELKVSEAEQVIDLHIRRSPLLLKQHLRILAQLTEADATKPLQT